MSRRNHLELMAPDLFGSYLLDRPSAVICHIQIGAAIPNEVSRISNLGNSLDTVVALVVYAASFQGIVSHAKDSSGRPRRPTSEEDTGSCDGNSSHCV